MKTKCRIQGLTSSLPVFVAPAAMAKMVHTSGEKGIAAACANKGIIQCVSSDAVLLSVYPRTQLNLYDETSRFPQTPPTPSPKSSPQPLAATRSSSNST